MKELDLKEIQQIEVKLLLEFDSICRKEKFRYSLGGGTLLGAIRHKGFIPWDDDVDVMMPRPDYEAFIKYCEEQNVTFKLITYENEKGYNGLFAKLSDLSTEIIDEVNTVDYTIGVNIDVFPLDGLGRSEKEAIKLFRKTSFDREVLNATAWKKYFRSKTHGILLEPVRFIIFILSRFANPKKLLNRIDEQNLKQSFEESSFAGCVCGSYREREIMPTNTFTEYTEVEFESIKLLAISNYDAYLTKHYNNYMQLPPEDKRQTHHTYKAYLK